MNTDRRRFITASASVLAGACAIGSSQVSIPGQALGAEPFARTGEPRFRLGLAAYSLRDYFSFMKGKVREPADASRGIDMVGFLDYCAAHGFEAAELTSYFFRPDADDDYFLELKRQAFLKGVTISGTAIGNNFTRGAGAQLDQEIESALRWIDHAAVLGAPHIRFFAGTGRELDEHPERMPEAIDAIRRCAEHAATKGIFLGVENHGNLQPEQLLKIIHQVDHPWVGINLDTGNFLSDDPYADLEMCVPYAVNVQVKSSMKNASGKKFPADFDRVAKILRDGRFQGFVILEYEDEAPYENIPKITESLRKSLA